MADDSGDLTVADIAFIVQELDTELNANILDSLLHGVYTGILVITFVEHIKAMVAVIVLLHILTTINFAFQWSYMRSIVVDNAQDLGTKFVRIFEAGDPFFLETGITSAICTILADSTMIWRCWNVSATVFKIISIHRQLTDGTNDDLLTPVLYASFSLGTTLWSTLLIIYRVWTKGRTNERGLGAYRHVFEVLIESSALYSASLILFVAFFAHNDGAANYLDPITGIARGIAPTLLVGRVAAGHARPDDSWEGSVMTSLRFGEERVQESAQEGTLISINLDDVEAQSVDDEHRSQVEDHRTQRVAQDYNVETPREKADSDLSTALSPTGKGY
ncbi:hypothetical protein F5146DRAFT_1169787 [Armillaria mellea]|nr:hypothetical protein F5146DRAFT_1169787 [Armillaria mellea]